MSIHRTAGRTSRTQYIMLNRVDSIPEEDEDAVNGGIHIVRNHFEEDEEDLIMQSIKHSPYDDDHWKNKSEADALGKYEDFHTIDWSRDRMRDRIRFRKVNKMKHTGTLLEKLKVLNLKVLIQCGKE